MNEPHTSRTALQDTCVCMYVCPSVCICMAIYRKFKLNEWKRRYTCISNFAHMLKLFNVLCDTSIASSPGPAQKLGKGPGHTCKTPVCAMSAMSLFGVEESRSSIANYYILDM